MQKAKPVLLAMIVCDQIIREEGTKKISLIGLFNTIHALSFPCVHSQMHIYTALTDYFGPAKCEYRFYDDTEKLIANFSGSVDFPDKLAVVEINYSINNLPLPKEGIYHLDFLRDGNIIGHRKFIVTKIEEEK